MTYSPLYISKMEGGLVQSRQEFILPDDAYPELENAFIWRERIKRRQGLQELGRLRRTLTGLSLGNTVNLTLTYTFANIFASFIPPIAASETNKEIQSLVINVGAPDTATFTENGSGGFIVTGKGVSAGSSINYATGAVTIVISSSIGGAAITANINYFPHLPVMGLRTRELNSINNEMMVAFDTIYAYRYSATGFVELSPGTTWSGNDANFFWSTNYWVSAANNKIFWVTNFSGTSGDPIRYYDGVAWTNFGPTAAPQTGQIDVSGNFLNQALAMLPYRGRMLMVNTLEGTSLATSTQFAQRIRWAAIGNPFLATAWRSDIRGKGGFLDIPTSESITSIGFVRDNMVVYCERSTWQLRYTGRSIAPFQIERVNSELGASSTFSAVQFDTSLVGIGDKGIVECDSYKSNRIDIKIPDLVFQFSNDNSGPQRIQGIRDIQQRLAYWIYVDKNVAEDEQGEDGGTEGIYPNRRLVYNYENDSWAIFTDSLTALGTFQPSSGITWANADFPWSEANFPWLNRPSLFPALMGGNQQGFVMYLGSNITPQVSNDSTLSIHYITGHTTTATEVGSPSHNMVNGQVISISGIPTGTGYSSLNGQKFSVIISSPDVFFLYKYNSSNGQFNIPQTDAPQTYIGSGQISLRDGFSIVSKKFNFLDQGQNIQIGYLDILADSTAAGSISMNVFINYANNPSQSINTLPENIQASTGKPDEFFNTIVPTTQTQLGGLPGSKYTQRVYCSARGAFITIQYTLSNAQLIGVEQESDLQIDSQIIWQRPAGRLQTF